jgi:hypothetical protein
MLKHLQGFHHLCCLLGECAEVKIRRKEFSLIEMSTKFKGAVFYKYMMAWEEQIAHFIS